MSQEPLLRVINLTKTFGSLTAVQNVSFDLYPGEVVGLAGSIGSGKSVLILMLAGLYSPNHGDVYFGSQRMRWPFHAKDYQIGVIHQKPELADRLDITSNLFLGHELGVPSFLGWWRIPDRKQMDDKARQILQQLDVKVSSLHQRVGELSSEQRQMIAIGRLLTQPVKLVIIDEPTILLSYPNQQRLLSLFQSWRIQGVAVLFSSNKLGHLFQVSDRILILRQGRKVAELDTDHTTREEVVAALFGYDDGRDLTPALWALDGIYRTRESMERLRYYQMLLEKDLAAQDSLNRQLFEQLSEQLRTLDQANLALQEAHRRLLSEREEERKSLARELHDDVIQDLLSVNYRLEEIEENSTSLKGDLAQIREQIRRLVGEVRQICGNLRPPTIDSLGLGAAIQSYSHEWSDRTGIEVHLDLDPNLGRLPELTELSIFRIIQEGLNNVWKHAHATNVEVKVQHTSPRTLLISIMDDGQGIPEHLDLNELNAQGHYGLLGINERVALLGGRFRLQHQPGGGTLLQVEIPHPRVETVFLNQLDV